ncbi:hypothetical protein ACJJTC_009425 [Scirpophaga incertulas]
MSTFNLPEKLVISGNLPENWKFFEQALNIYLTASDLHKCDDERKIAILLNVIGEDGVKIYNNFEFKNEKKSYEEVIKKFKQYCEPKTSVLHSRFLFYNRKQDVNEPFDSFLTDIKKLAKDCKFQNNDESIRDRLVFGTSDMDTQRKLIMEGDAKIEEVVKKLRFADIARKHIEVVQGSLNSQTITVDKITKRNLKNMVNCKWCGRQHEANIKLCPARGKTCTKCNKLNHFATVCRSRYVGKVNNQNVPEEANCDDNDEIEFYCNHIHKNI